MTDDDRNGQKIVDQRNSNKTTEVRTDKNSNSSKARKLILHFDQHNTIQVACTLPGRSLTVEEGLNNFLTSAVWGKEDEHGEWICLSNEPQINRPANEPDSITYFKFLEKKIVKSPSDRAELKKLTCQFVFTEPGSKFREFFDLYLESLIYNERICNKEVEGVEEEEEKSPPPCNTMPAGDPENKSLYHLILPDFFDMIKRLQKERRDFCIILRTMGIESECFLDTISSVFDAKFHQFRDIKPLKVNPSIGQIRRSLNDRIELEMNGQLYTSDEEIYEKLCSLEGINAIQDDFAFWQQNNYECYSAKPLWINLLDKSSHHIIFDDNIRLDSVDDCIVNIRLLSRAIKDFESVDFESYELFEKSSIIQPNLIQLLNPLLKRDSTKGYYYEKIKKAEKVYDLMLENSDKLNILIKSDLDSSIGLSKNNSNQNATKTEADIEAENFAKSVPNVGKCDELEQTDNSQSLEFQKLIAVFEKKQNENQESNVNCANSRKISTSKKKLKIKLERVMSKEEELVLEQDDTTTVSKICSVQ